MLYYSSMAHRTGIKTHLKRYRCEHGDLTQQELAERVGVTRQTIISIERGKYQPTVELALRLARVFGVPVEVLFELDQGEAEGS
jgi:putative transcriptional regulator